MFGQPLDPDVFTRAGRAAAACDVFLAVGSTLTVEPAASLCRVAVPAGAALVIVNRDPTPYDPLAAGSSATRSGRPSRGSPATARRHRPGLTPGPRHQAQARTPRGTRPASGGAVSALGWTSGR